MSDRVSTDRNLLFGILALQMDFISRDALIGAMNAWVIQKDKPLGEVLVERGELAKTRRDLLEGLVDEHVRAHAGDAARSLQAISSAGDIADDLQHIGDEQIQASLGYVRRIASLTQDYSGVAATVLPPVGPQTFWTGRFRIVRPHAKGGLGIVSIAMDDELDREVAFKEIKHEFAEHQTSRARFVLEAEITGKLEHPGIVPIYGLGHAPDGSPFYAMRFIRGDSLADAINRFHDPAGPFLDPVKRSLQLRELLGRFLDVCDAMAYAHSRGVLHRDLKPGNVMLGPFGETLVVDWGLALALERVPEGHNSAHGAIKPTKTDSSSLPDEKGATVGTLAYMPPEQAEGNLDKLGPRSDVYGLGAILYDLLTGKFPNTGDSLPDLLKSIRDGRITPPRQIRPDISPSLEAVCLKALALDPQDRYASPRNLGTDIKAWLADEPVSARREPFSEHARRWAKRNKTAVTGLAAALLVGLIGFGAVAAVQTRARNTLDAKNQELDGKNGELVQANIDLNLQRTRAEDREDQAIDAVKKFRDAIVNEPELKASPALESLRKRLLKEPLAFFRTLRERLQADQDTRPDSLNRLAEACFDLAVLTNEIGDKRDALLEYRDALAINQKLADSSPSLMVAQINLAKCQSNMGVLLSATGGIGEALETHKKALAIRQKFADANPTENEYQIALTESLENIGLLFNSTGQKFDAQESLKKALAIRQKLADANPADAHCQNELAQTLNRMGTASSTAADALGYFKKAVAIWQKLARANPTVTEYQKALAAGHFNLAAMFVDTGHTNEAMESEQEALAIRQKLADENPSIPQYQNELARSLHNFANLLRATGQRGADALEFLKKAGAIWQKLSDANPTVTEYEHALATVYFNLGWMQSEAGQNDEALATQKKALAIRQKLVDASPSITEHQSALAESLNCVAYILYGRGQVVEALAIWKKDLVIRQKLADANPAVTQYQSNLAQSLNNSAVMLGDAGQKGEAMENHKKALGIRQKLADANPTVILFQNELAVSLNNIGNLLAAMDQKADALESYKKSLAIRQKLADAIPADAYRQNELALGLTNIAIVSSAADALEFTEKAVAIFQKLADANPAVAGYQGYLAACAINIGEVHLKEKRFPEARDRFRTALIHLKKALSKEPSHPQFRSFMKMILDDLESAGRELKDPAILAEVQREREAFEKIDPVLVALDRKLTAVSRGEAKPENNAERLELAQRSYDKSLHALAATFWADALAADPKLAESRELKVPFNAARAAALATSGKGKDVPAPGDAAKSKLRGQAQQWLKGELATWTKVLESDSKTNGATVVQALEQWKQDSALDGIRDQKSIELLPEPERAAWRKLWADVDALLTRARSGK